MGNEENRAAARRLVRSLDQREVIALLHEEQQVHLQEQEQSKVHALQGFSLGAEQWGLFRAHLSDGGGMTDLARIGRALLAAVMADDQAAFWSELPHALKVLWKSQGLVEVLPGGAVRFNGVSVDGAAGAGKGVE